MSKIQGFLSRQDECEIRDVFGAYAVNCHHITPVFIELGTYKGRSTNIIADTLQSLLGNRWELFSVDNFTYRLTREEHKERDVNIAGFEDRVKLVATDSAIFANQFPREVISGIFIDADHSYEGCLRDIHAWLPKIRQDGFVSGHDYRRNMPGRVIRAVREVFGNKAFAQPRTSVWKVWKSQL